MNKMTEEQVISLLKKGEWITYGSDYILYNGWRIHCNIRDRTFAVYKRIGDFTQQVFKADLSEKGKWLWFEYTSSRIDKEHPLYIEYHKITNAAENKEEAELNQKLADAIREENL